MALNNPSKFESEETTNTADAQVAETVEAKVAETVLKEKAPEKQASAEIPGTETVKATTEVVVAKSSALAAPREGSPAAILLASNRIAELQNALPVTWEDFQTIQASQGQFGVKGDANMQLGNKIEVRIISHQSLYVSSPRDMDAEGEGLVKFSDDGININDDGGTVADHQAELKALGHEDSAVAHKAVIVGELISCGEAGMDLIGDLVQVHLPDTGRRSFESHAKQSAFHIAEGRLSKDDAEYVSFTAKLAGMGKKQYTLVKLGYADGHGSKRPGEKLPSGTVEG